MNLQELVNEFVLPQVEVVVEKLVEAKSDAAVELLVAELIKVCPIDVVDMYIKSQEPKLKELLKAFLLSQAEKISDKV